MSFVPTSQMMSDQMRKPMTDKQAPLTMPRSPPQKHVANACRDGGQDDHAHRLSNRRRVALDILEGVRIQLHRADYPVSKSHRTLHRRGTAAARTV